MRTCALRVRVRSLCASGRVSKRAHAMTRCDVLRRAQVRRARALRTARFAGSVHTQARNHGERAPGCAGRRACVLAPLARGAVAAVVAVMLPLAGRTFRRSYGLRYQCRATTYMEAARRE